MNFFCGSDYVCNNFSSLDVKNYIKNTLYASFDGDADRVVFYCRFQDQMYLMDGDKILGIISRSDIITAALKIKGQSWRKWILAIFNCINL